MDPLLRAARAIARAGIWAGGSLLFATALLIGVEVLARKLLNASTGGADELSGMALAMASAWALPFALLERAHIRIDTLYSLMPTRIAALLDMVGLLAFLVFFGHIAWYGWAVFRTSVRLGSVSLSAVSVPLAVPQLIWVAGHGFFVLTVLLLLVRAFTFLLRGEAAEVVRLVGSRTAQEETREELEDARRRRGATL